MISALMSRFDRFDRFDRWRSPFDRASRPECLRPCVSRESFVSIWSVHGVRIDRLATIARTCGALLLVMTGRCGR
jgi:hypothetical protein